MDRPPGDVTGFLARLQGISPEDRAELLEELRVTDQELYAEVISEVELMEAAREAIPTRGLSIPAQSPRPDSFVGASLGGYTVDARIGLGGMGAVYRASRTTPFRQSVAIKVLHPLLATDEFRERFAVEQRALASLDHPSVATILDAGEHGGIPFLVMELFEGDPIDRYCEQSQSPASLIARLIELVSQGVQHAHERGVIHRDIKPSNILVRDIDGEPVVKIIDFGIARISSGDPPSTEHAATPMGTPVFASPEQRDPSGAGVTVRSDVYSLGATLRSLLSEQGRTGGVRSRRDLDAVLSMATAPEPDDRYASAAAFAADLSRLRTGRPVEARRLGAAARTARWVGAHPIGSALAGMAALLAVIAAMALAQSSLRDAERRSATEAFDETQRYYLGSLLGLAHSRELGSNTRLRDLVSRLTSERHSAFEQIGSPALRARSRAEMLLGLATLWIDLEDSATALTLLQESEEAARSGGVFTDEFRRSVLIRRADAAMREADLELALASGREALELARLGHGPDSREASQVGSYLGLVYVEAGEWGSARELLESSLQIDTVRLGDDHIDTIRSLGNLAFLSMREGDAREAAARYAEIVERLDTPGNRHPADLFLAQRQLGSLYVQLERYSLAAPLLQDAIEGMTALHGEGHPEVIRPITRLADAIAGLGRPEEALPLYEVAIRAAHDGTLSWIGGAEAVRSLAQTLTALGRQADAIAALTDGLDRVKEALGNDHSSIIGMTGQLAKAYRTTGRHDLAIPLYQDSLARCLAHARGDESNRRVLVNRNNLANALLDGGRFDDAAAQFRAIAGVMAEHDPDDVVHGWALRGLGRALSAANRFPEAERALLEAVSELGRSQGAESPRTNRAIQSLMDNYEAWGSVSSMSEVVYERMTTWQRWIESGGAWPVQKDP